MFESGVAWSVEDGCHATMAWEILHNAVDKAIARVQVRLQSVPGPGGERKEGERMAHVDVLRTSVVGRQYLCPMLFALGCEGGHEDGAAGAR